MAERPAAKPPVVLLTRFWLPVLLYLGLINFLSAQPDLQVPMPFPNADKLYHMMEYLVLGVLLGRASRASLPRGWPLVPALMAVGLGVCVGGLDEFLQSFVPGRTSSVNDLLADTTGLLFSQFIYLLVARA